MADEHKTDEQLKAEADAAAKAGKVEFSPEQQAKIQGLIDEAYKKAYAKAGGGSSAEIKDYEALKAELAALKAGGGKGKESEEVKALTAKLDEFKAALEKKNARELEDSIFREVAKFNVMDAAEVTTLLRAGIKADENGVPMVVNADGSPRLNLNATPTRPMTVSEFIADWLKTRPHHLRASGRAGAGSPGVKFGGEGGKEYDLSNPETIRNMPREDLDKLIADGIAVRGSGGQVFRFKTSGNAFIDARKARFAKK